MTFYLCLLNFSELPQVPMRIFFGVISDIYLYLYHLEFNAKDCNILKFYSGTRFLST